MCTFIFAVQTYHSKYNPYSQRFKYQSSGRFMSQIGRQENRLILKPMSAHSTTLPFVNSQGFRNQVLSFLHGAFIILAFINVNLPTL